VDLSNVVDSVIRTAPDAEPSFTVTVARFSGRLVTPSLSVHVGGVPVGAASSGHVVSTADSIQYVRPSGPVIGAPEIETTDSHAPRRNYSICWSARVPAVVVLLARLMAPKPELKPATRAKMPMLITVMAMSSSTIPKPSSWRARGSTMSP
jgi:hypothetical protein